jgi:regulator of sirC expression with transglutaminase-like and TPR domain
LLFVILADRLDLPVTVSTAPLHIFVKYTEKGTGKSFNIETTSGAHVARDAWYREKMPMSDAAIANGVYLAPLTKEETVALMADTLVEHYLVTKQYQSAMAIAEVMLAAYPRFAHAMVSRGTAAAYLLEETFYQRYPTPDAIPSTQRSEYLQLVEINRSSFDQAEALGWRPVK